MGTCCHCKKEEETGTLFMTCDTCHEKVCKDCRHDSQDNYDTWVATYCANCLTAEGYEPYSGKNYLAECRKKELKEMRETLDGGNW